MRNIRTLTKVNPGEFSLERLGLILSSKCHPAEEQKELAGNGPEGEDPRQGAHNTLDGNIHVAFEPCREKQGF